MKTAELLSRVYLQQPRLASLKMRMNFTVTATLPNAKPGDVMQVDLLKLQPHPNSESDQLLPIQGTRKETTVDSSLRATVTYTKAEAEMTEVGRSEERRVGKEGECGGRRGCGERRRT